MPCSIRVQHCKLCKAEDVVNVPSGEDGGSGGSERFGEGFGGSYCLVGVVGVKGLGRVLVGHIVWWEWWG